MSENVLLPLLTDDLRFISRLSDRPSQTEPDNLSPEAFKAKFDKAANLIQEYINYQLIPAIIAEKVPLTSDSIGTEESPARNVKEAILWLKKQIDNVQAGRLTDISIGLEHLTKPVTDLLNLNTPIISAVAPTNENHGVGKIWLHTSDGSPSGALKGIYIQVDISTWRKYVYPRFPLHLPNTQAWGQRRFWRWAKKGSAPAYLTNLFPADSAQVALRSHRSYHNFRSIYS